MAKMGCRREKFTLQELHQASNLFLLVFAETKSKQLLRLHIQSVVIMWIPNPHMECRGDHDVGFSVLALHKTQPGRTNIPTIWLQIAFDIILKTGCFSQSVI